MNVSFFLGPQMYFPLLKVQQKRQIPGLKNAKDIWRVSSTVQTNLI